MNATTGPRRGALAVAGAVLLRAVALVLLARGVAWLVATAYRAAAGNDTGAIIGAGLIAMLVAAVGAGVWGLIDAYRGRDKARTLAVIWCCAGILVAVAMAITADVDLGRPELPDGAVVAADLVSVAPLLAALIAAPALLGIALGTSFGATRHPGARQN